MDADEYRRMAALQESHWWFRAKRRMATALLERYHGAPGPPGAARSTDAPGSAERSRAGRILEVGCGTGAMLPVLGRWGTPVGADAHLPALRHVGGAHRVAADASRLPFRADTFELIGCFDVLYHRGIPDVPAALAELHRVCAPGGTLVITDSAFPFLRSAHDVATHGARRFRLPGMQRLLEDAGFEMVHGTYFHKVLFPVAVLVRLTKRMIWGAPPLECGAGGDEAPTRPDEAPARPDEVPTRPEQAPTRPEQAPTRPEQASARPGRVPARSDLAATPAWLNAVLGPLYRIETWMAARVRQPFGTSLAVVARKRNFR